MAVEVLDENDNAPVFEKEIYYLNVTENTVPSAPILKLTTFDKDLGDNAQFTYSIAPNDKFDDNIVAIHPQNGYLELRKELDREDKSEYLLVIECIDDGNPPQIGRTLVHVTVDDQNDNPPKFNKLLKADVYENVPIGTHFYTIKATDSDENSQLRYKILNGTYSSYFDVEEHTGNVFTAKAIDREVVEEMDLQILCYDNEWQVTTQMAIYIQDVNDNAPKFTHDYYNFTISPKVQIDGIIGTIHATDADIGKNAKVSYFIKTSDENVRIDVTSGNIILVRAFNSNHWLTGTTVDSRSLEFTAVTFTVIARDHGYPSLHSTTKVALFVPVVSKFDANVQKMLYDTLAVYRATTQLDHPRGNDYSTGFENQTSIETTVLTSPDALPIEYNATGLKSFNNTTKAHIVIERSNFSAYKFQQPFYNITVLETDEIDTELLDFKVNLPPTGAVSIFKGDDEHYTIEISDLAGNMAISTFYVIVDDQIDNAVTNNTINYFYVAESYSNLTLTSVTPASYDTALPDVKCNIEKSDHNLLNISNDCDLVIGNVKDNMTVRISANTKQKIVKYDVNLVVMKPLHGFDSNIDVIAIELTGTDDGVAQFVRMFDKLNSDVKLHLISSSLLSPYRHKLILSLINSNGILSTIEAVNILKDFINRNKGKLSIYKINIDANLCIRNCSYGEKCEAQVTDQRNVYRYFDSVIDLPNVNWKCSCTSLTLAHQDSCTDLFTGFTAYQSDLIPTEQSKLQLKTTPALTTHFAKAPVVIDKVYSFTYNSKLVLNHIQNVSKIEFLIITEASNGVLVVLYNDNSSQFVTVDIADGYVRLFSKDTDNVVSKFRINDKTWYKLSMHLTPTIVTLSITPCVTTDYCNITSESTINLNYSKQQNYSSLTTNSMQNIMFGSTGNMSELASDTDFHGCLTKVNVNNFPIDKYQSQFQADGLLTHCYLTDKVNLKAEKLNCSSGERAYLYGEEYCNCEDDVYDSTCDYVQIEFKYCRIEVIKNGNGFEVVLSASDAKKIQKRFEFEEKVDKEGFFRIKIGFNQFGQYLLMIDDKTMNFVDEAFKNTSTLATLEYITIGLPQKLISKQESDGTDNANATGLDGCVKRLAFNQQLQITNAKSQQLMSNQFFHTEFPNRPPKIGCLKAALCTQSHYCPQNSTNLKIFSLTVKTWIILIIGFLTISSIVMIALGMMMKRKKKTVTCQRISNMKLISSCGREDCKDIQCRYDLQRPFERSYEPGFVDPYGSVNVSNGNSVCSCENPDFISTASIAYHNSNYMNLSSMSTFNPPPEYDYPASSAEYAKPIAIIYSPRMEVGYVLNDEDVLNSSAETALYQEIVYASQNNSSRDN
ncbi:unnamed protein product [Bursaphelenchus okinawaensis]|uniref:CA domain-containing protein n=1 Tax=Bursaphelenchus okinawaensis TaxID=465554 RepID=A0A811KCS8_9BILA|nr:unnamed protein product [Bursaphelenchus okinawaensis]CAG9101834.1 unnamed protein product [Bursaphelenchus okinawaensis]